MNLIYIHSNFPGQFIDIAPFVAKNIASRTIFLTVSDNPQQIRLEGVEVVRFKTHRQPSSDVHRYLHSSEKAVLLGQAVLRAVDQLCNDGFVPDVAAPPPQSTDGLRNLDFQGCFAFRTTPRHPRTPAAGRSRSLPSSSQIDALDPSCQLFTLNQRPAAPPSTRPTPCGRCSTRWPSPTRRSTRPS